jgi:hypothetical protein
MKDNQNIGYGLSFCSLLAIVLITLKLLKLIDLSWWIVLAPIWIPYLLVAVILIVIVIVAKLKNK